MQNISTSLGRSPGQNVARACQSQAAVLECRGIPRCLHRRAQNLSWRQLTPSATSRPVDRVSYVMRDQRCNYWKVMVCIAMTRLSGFLKTSHIVNVLTETTCVTSQEVLSSNKACRHHKWINSEAKCGCTRAIHNFCTFGNSGPAVRRFRLRSHILIPRRKIEKLKLNEDTT